MTTRAKIIRQAEASGWRIESQARPRVTYLALVRGPSRIGIEFSRSGGITTVNTRGIGSRTLGYLGPRASGKLATVLKYLGATS